MNTKSLLAIALAALLVFAGGAAALPSQAAGADAADDHQPDDPGANASDADDDDGNVTDADDARDENASEGPPTEMPEQAPEHVSQIHELVRDKLDGTLGNQTLGEAISGLVGGGDQADSHADAGGDESDNAADASEDARSNAAQAGPPSSLPGQAADRVGQIHDAILSFLTGDGDGNPGDAVSSAAQG